jgi:gamma-glutamyltranspeptidase/glutathione hydrolase
VVAVGSLIAVAGLSASGSDDGIPPESVWPPLHWLDPLAPAPVGAVGESAMVATASEWATNAALDVLRDGGNAADAAIAAQFVLNVVEPSGSGIGGGCFIVYLPSGAREPIVIDGRETAPGAAPESLFLSTDGAPQPIDPDRVTGGRPVGVPGTPAALDLLHRAHGSLPIARLLEPAIALAEGGFPVSRRLHAGIVREGDRLRRFPASRALLFDADGAPLREGQRLRQPALAATFRALADRGLDAFYRGEIADDVVRAVRESPVNPGRLAREDLERYAARVRSPVHGRYRGLDLYGPGPPSSGAVAVIEILQILEGFDLNDAGPGSLRACHLLIEAQKLAFEDRNRTIGDPDFVAVPVSMLCSPSYARERGAAIDPDRAAIGAPAARRAIEPNAGGMNAAPVKPSAGDDGRETTHLSIVDARGNLISMTSTLEQEFGSAILVGGRGFFLNNELSDFDPVPRDAMGRPVPNRVEGGKRPRSSMAPMILVDGGRPYLAVGSAGGSRIIGAVANVIVNVVDFRMDIQAAINFPRAINIGAPSSELELLYFLEGFLGAGTGAGRTVAGLGPTAAGPLRTLARLQTIGHVIEAPKPAFRASGGVQAVLIDAAARRAGGADPRREGVALGY